MIEINAAKCSGCRRCEVNCSFFHSGFVGRSHSRIKVVKIEAIGIDYPVVCRQCLERYCTKCPESALSVGPLGQIDVSEPLCTACGTCEKLCPIGAIEVIDEIPRVCDLCGGDPQCVKQCTLNAITFSLEKSGSVSLKNEKKLTKKMNPEEKRVQFAMETTRSLRGQWLNKRSA